MPQSIPKVAQVEDYDSDESSVKPGTCKKASRKTPSAPPKSLSRYKHGHVDGASDSGYSSRTSGTQASNASAGVQTAGSMQPPPRPSTAQGQMRSKPVIHRTDSQSTRPRAPSRSASTSRRGSDQCNDPNCGHSACLAVRYPGRRFSITEQQYAPQYAASPIPYQPLPQYQYAQVSQAQTSQTVPTLNSYPQPRPRSGSATRQARPMSIHGYPYQAPSGTSTPGPPPSSSAYQNLAEQWAHYYHQVQQVQAQQRAYQQQQAAYAAATQNQAYSVQPQPSPVAISPTSPKFSTSARLQRAYSARVAAPLSATSAPTGQQFPTSLGRTSSTRQMSARTYNVPGAFPRADESSSESDSESEDSSSEMSEEEERDRRARARDSRLMSSSSQRRPSIKKQYVTAPVIPTIRTSREILHRNPRSDHLDYVSSSDNMDSDRTTRAMVDRPRTTTTYTDSSRSSRRPSLSTTASSGRTRATTLSSATSGMASLVLESKTGRRISYLSKRDQDKYAREQDEAQRRRDAIEAYQDSIRGGKVDELTAEKLRGVQSAKSSRSSSRPYNPGEGVRIESGGAVIHVYGGQKVEMMTGREGGAASFVIGSQGGREGTYLGGSSSKSSGSRVGRSAGGGSEVGGVGREGTIREEFAVGEATTG